MLGVWMRDWRFILLHPIPQPINCVGRARPCRALKLCANVGQQKDVARPTWLMFWWFSTHLMGYLLSPQPTTSCRYYQLLIVSKAIYMRSYCYSIQLRSRRPFWTIHPSADWHRTLCQCQRSGAGCFAGSWMAGKIARNWNWGIPHKNSRSHAPPRPS